MVSLVWLEYVCAQIYWECFPKRDFKSSRIKIIEHDLVIIELAKPYPLKISWNSWVYDFKYLDSLTLHLDL